MGVRPPLQGYNHNIRYRNRTFHVQTEDSGLDNPHIFTHLFLDGQIISTARFDYKHLLSEPNGDVTVRKTMQDQHKTVMKQLRRGDLDAKIIALTGALDPAGEPSAAAESPAPPPAATVPAEAQPALPAGAAAAAAAGAAPEKVEELPAAESLADEMIPEIEELPSFDEIPAHVQATLPTLAEQPALELHDTDPGRPAATGAAAEVDPDFEPTQPGVSQSAPTQAAVAVAQSAGPLSVEITEAIDLSTLQPLEPEQPALDVTQPVDMKALHALAEQERAGGLKPGQAQPARFGVEELPPEKLPLFPEAAADEDVGVLVEASARMGEVADPSVVPAQLFRETPEAAVPGATRPTPHPRGVSKVFGQPLPSSGRFGTPDEALPSFTPRRRSGVYLVPGGPPQRPPHPDPNVRQPRVQVGSSPQRYTAPSRGSSSELPVVTPRVRRRTGSYALPGGEPAEPASSGASTRPISSGRGRSDAEAQIPPVRPARVSGRFPVQPPAGQAPPAVIARPVVVLTEPGKGSPAKARSGSTGPLRPEPALQGKRPPASQPPPPPPRTVEPPPPPAAFGADLISERSLDEVILAYLAEDSEGPGDE